MRRDGRLGVVLGAALLLAACGRKPPPDDPYLADLKQRVERLRPEVEREIGRKIRKVEVLVLPRKQIVEGSIPSVRERLARIENGPTGEELEAEARAWAEGGAENFIAQVDDRGRIVFPDPADEGLLRMFASLRTSEFARDPRALDVILLHELVHVHQHWHLETPAFHASARSRADLLARTAVLEGHAEHLTRRIASRLGFADTYARYLARHEPGPAAQEWIKLEHRVAAADQLYAYVQGAAFVDAVVERLGYDEALRRIFKSPPSLAAVSRPEQYFAGNPPSRWGTVAEDLRRWLARERGQARLHVIALPMVTEMAGDVADGFREGFHLDAGRIGTEVYVLVAESEAGAQELHRAWTRGLEQVHEARMASGFFDEIRHSRDPDDWTLDYDWRPQRMRQSVLRAGSFVVDVRCTNDSELEQRAERLARRAARFLTDASWRKAWLEGDGKLLQGDDPGLRLAAVSRMRRFVPDEDWEVRWLGRLCEAKDEKRSEAERTASLVAAIEDSHPAVVASGLRAAGDLWLRELPWPLLRGRLVHREAAVRRAAWALMGLNVAWDEHPDEWQAPKAEAVDLVAHALDDEDVAVRDGAVDCLHKLEGEPGLLPLFRKALVDDHPRVRQNALITLSVYDFDFPELLPEIVDLADERPDVAAEALGNLGPAAVSALPRLRELLLDPKARTEAAAAIWKIAGDAEPLFAVVAESVAKGEPTGLGELGEMEAAAQPMASHVAKALAHENRWVRIAAAEALEKIGGPEAKAELARRLEVENEPKVVEALRKAVEAIDKP